MRINLALNPNEGLNLSDCQYVLNFSELFSRLENSHEYSGKECLRKNLIYGIIESPNMASSGGQLYWVMNFLFNSPFFTENFKIFFLKHHNTYL